MYPGDIGVHRKLPTKRNTVLPMHQGQDSKGDEKSKKGNKGGRSREFDNEFDGHTLWLGKSENLTATLIAKRPWHLRVYFVLLSRKGSQGTARCERRSVPYYKDSQTSPICNKHLVGDA
jgi:hypothetical protein